jgi:ABC-type amino acid transport substrate-binding protein
MSIRRFVHVLVLFVLAGWLVPSPAHAAPLQVGTKEVPPFSYRDADGNWRGSSIELWEDIAKDMDVQYEFVERDLEGLLNGVEDGSLDVAVAAITVTSERERRVDFTHPFYTTGLAIAVPREETPLWWAAAGSILSEAFLQLIAVLAVLQLIVGTIVWVLERRTNPEQFGGGLFDGIASGFWWSTVTMTTVGYGDKAPVTSAGRLVALGWMLCSVIIVSLFTATVASNLTVDRLATELRRPDDLDRVRVGTVPASTSEAYARKQDLDYRNYEDLDAALQALVQGEVGAVVYDAPLLENAVKRMDDDEVEILEARFQRQDYAIALPNGSPLREPINQLLPDKLRRDD